MLMAITDFFKRGSKSVRRYPRRGELSFTNTAIIQPKRVASEKSGPSYEATKQRRKATNEKTQPSGCPDINRTSATLQ